MKKILSFILLCAVTLTASDKGQLPNIKLKDLNKKKVMLQSLPEEGPVLINFWTLSCEPCKKEMKYLNEYHNKYSDNDFKVFSVNMDTPRSMSKVKAYVKSQDYAFKVLSDPRSEIFRKLGGKAMPFLILVNNDGTIYERHVGYNPGDEIALEKEIRELIVHNNTDAVFEDKTGQKLEN